MNKLVHYSRLASKVWRRFRDQLGGLRFSDLVSLFFQDESLVQWASGLYFSPKIKLCPRQALDYFLTWANLDEPTKDHYCSIYGDDMEPQYIIAEIFADKFS